MYTSDKMRHFLLALFPGISTQLFAQNSQHFNVENGLVLQGYDPMTSFSNKAVRGDITFAANDQGAVYLL